MLQPSLRLIAQPLQESMAHGDRLEPGRLGSIQLNCGTHCWLALQAGRRAVTALLYSLNGRHPLLPLRIPQCSNLCCESTTEIASHRSTRPTVSITYYICTSYTCKKHESLHQLGNDNSLRKAKSYVTHF